VPYLALAIVAGLAAVERKGFLQAMLSRPVALAPITGWVLGDLEAGVLLAAPLELLWLGAVNLGAALPVHEALATAAITGGAVLSGRALGVPVGPEIALLSALVCFPLAVMGRRADRLTERWNERLADRAERELVAGHFRKAARTNLWGLALPFVVAALLAPAGAAVAAVVVPAALGALPSAAPLRVGFFAFFAFACAAGARAMRARAAPGYFYVAFAGALALGLVAGGAHP
jgi:mannose/fructose/N-acetylgalactosamine-specific phosphotransferase system component IIC